MHEMSELKKSRPKVAELHKLQSNISSDDRGRPTREKMKEVSEAIGLLLVEKKQVSEKLKALNESRANTAGDLPELIKMRTEANELIQAQIKARNDLRQERKEQEQKYWKYQQELREARQVRAQEERQKRQEEY